MNNLDKYKTNTYLKLLNFNENSDAKKLILAALLIPLCYEKCILDNEFLVSDNFIKECSSTIVFKNKEPINIDFREKFKLIRNKLAHGDYSFDSESKTLYMKMNNNTETILEVSLDCIVNFAKHITNYYDYLNKEFPREKIIFCNGLKIKVTDYCNTDKRNNDYNRRYNRRIQKIFFTSKYRNVLFTEMLINKIVNMNLNKIMNIKFEIIGNTTQKNGITENPHENPLVFQICNKINEKETDEEYDQIIELLMKFYASYIFPLDNFLKVDDNGVESLKDEKMFDFSQLNISSIEKSSEYEKVGKVENYYPQLENCYKKLSKLCSKKESLEKYQRVGEQHTSEIIGEIEKEIKELIKLFSAGSIQRMHSYAKNRSIIEQLRCSIMHGNYYYDEKNKNVVFTDYNKGEKVYEEQITIEELYRLFNIKNDDLISKQFSTVYGINKKK